MGRMTQPTVCLIDAVTDMLTDGDSLSLEDALGAIQPMSPDNSDVVTTLPMVSF